MSTSLVLTPSWSETAAATPAPCPVTVHAIMFRIAACETRSPATQRPRVSGDLAAPQRHLKEDSDRISAPELTENVIAGEIILSNNLPRVTRPHRHREVVGLAVRKAWNLASQCIHRVDHLRSPSHLSSREILDIERIDTIETGAARSANLLLRSGGLGRVHS